MNTPPRLGYTILISNELAALRHFYAEVLGLEVIEQRPDYVKLDAGLIFIALRCPNRPYDHPAAGGSIQLAFPTNEVDQWAERLRVAGVEILEPPTDQTWGHRTVFASDPDGNLIEFYASVEPPDDLNI